jgi:phospholipid/cholesterol/gamma-HCH transport system permease protein
MSLNRVRLRAMYGIVINQIRFTGIDAMLLIGSVALLLGGTVIIQAMRNFPKFGIEDFIGNLMVIIIAREMGPLVAALVVVSRSGSAIAAELATQKQNGEFRALEHMGIDTLLFIVLPRIIASIISIFSLIVFFDIFAFVGGYIISLSSVFIPVNIFFRSLLDAFSLRDLLITLLKSGMYGIMIPVICSYYGFKPDSPFEIPIYVSRAVIRTLLVIFIINAVISALFYM